MATKITFDPKIKPPTSPTLTNLRIQKRILENQGGTTGLPELAQAAYTFQRAMELWPEAMAEAAAIVANTYAFSGTTLDALRDSDAP